MKRTPMKRSAPMSRASSPKPPRSKKCAAKGCSGRYVPDPATPFRRWCSDDCAHDIAMAGLEKAKAAQARAREAQARAERVETKKALAKFKKRPEFIAEAQAAFNAYIRERDRDLPCICCGSFDASGAGGIGGGWDCGHYISRAHASHLRFDERNAHKQRKGCNRPGGTTRAKYRAGLVARYSEQYVAELEALEYAPPSRDMTKEELVTIKETYQQKLKQLKGTRP